MFAARSPSRHPDAPRAIAALNWSSGIASRGAGNGPSSIDPFQKSILDFAVDPVQPLFGAFCPFLIRLPHCLELRNSCFGGVKLMRKLERRVERMLMVSFGEVRCVVQHAQDRLSRSIELTGGGVFESRCKRYDSVRFGIGTIGLSTHRPPRAFVASPDGLKENGRPDRSLAAIVFTGQRGHGVALDWTRPLTTG
jgi:hypothetical protein